jgi:hypothetical protein
MTANDNHDPVNRWATEYYGSNARPDDSEAAHTPIDRDASPALPPALPPAARPPIVDVPRRRRTALIASGVLSLAMIAGIGGAAVAASDAGERGGGRGPASGHVGVVQFDGDGGGRAGDRDGGHR